MNIELTEAEREAAEPVMAAAEELIAAAEKHALGHINYEAHEAAYRADEAALRQALEVTIALALARAAWKVTTGVTNFDLAARIEELETALQEGP